jgi:hypothetical protein
MNEFLGLRATLAKTTPEWEGLYFYRVNSLLGKQQDGLFNLVSRTSPAGAPPPTKKRAFGLGPCLACDCCCSVPSGRMADEATALGTTGIQSLSRLCLGSLISGLIELESCT